MSPHREGEDSFLQALCQVSYTHMSLPSIGFSKKHQELDSEDLPPSHQNNPPPHTHTPSLYLSNCPPMVILLWLEAVDFYCWILSLDICKVQLGFKFPGCSIRNIEIGLLYLLIDNGRYFSKSTHSLIYWCGQTVKTGSRQYKWSSS